MVRNGIILGLVCGSINKVQGAKVQNLLQFIRVKFKVNVSVRVNFRVRVKLFVGNVLYLQEKLNLCEMSYQVPGCCSKTRF